MNKKFDEEVKKKLREDVDVPECVDEGIKRAYDMIGISGERKVIRRRKRIWPAVAAVAALTAGLSITAAAVNYYLKVHLEEEGQVLKYYIEVDKEQKEAHQIEVNPTYLPKGFEAEQAEEGAPKKTYGTAEGDSISIISYNAAELYRMSQLEENVFAEYRKDSYSAVEGEQKLDLFTRKNEKVDSDREITDVYLFSEEEGYGVWIWSESSLEQEELVKIANGLEITVLEETVLYPSEAEIAEERQNDKDAAKKAEAEQEYRSSNGVSEELVYQVGEEVKDTTREMMAESYPDYLREVYLSEEEDIRFTVLSTAVSDTLPTDTFSQQYFTTDMENWMNEDTSLKAHQRYRLGEEEGQTTFDARADKEAETVNSKYVIVKMKAKNVSAFQTDLNKTVGVSIAPILTVMQEGEAGKLVYPQETFWSANEGYDLQWGAERGGSFPIYFDKPYFTEGIKGVKSRLFCPLAPGEEMEYTLVYVVDEDQLSNMYLHFYPQNEIEINGEYLTTPYVDVSQ